MGYIRFHRCTLSCQYHSGRFIHAFRIVIRLKSERIVNFNRCHCATGLRTSVNPPSDLGADQKRGNSVRNWANWKVTNHVIHKRLFIHSLKAFESMALGWCHLNALAHPCYSEMKFHFVSHWIFTNDLALYGINLIRMKSVFTKSLPLPKRNCVAIPCAPVKICSAWHGNTCISMDL